MQFDRRRGDFATHFIAVVLMPCMWLLSAEPALLLGADDLAARFATRAEFDAFVQAGESSPFGLDYVFVHSPAARNRKLVEHFCREMGIRWVNLTRLDWKRVEPKPPSGGRHSYDWSDLDAAVREWQRNGVHIMVSLRFESPWATAPRSDEEFVYLKGPARHLALAGADYLPKPEHMAHLRAYVRSLVERYNGDGVNDMPGLRFPVRHYQVGNEYYNELFWAGSAEEYGHLLREVAGAARAACPDVKIILSGIGFRDVPGFYAAEMDPRTERFVRSRLPKVGPAMRRFVERAEAFSRTAAGFSDHYDILDARWPNYGIVAKNKALLEELGCPEKPVWSAEVYSGFPLSEPLVLPNWTLHAWPTPSRSGEYLRVLRRPAHRQFDEINRWYRGLQAAHVVKLCMVALDAGSEKLMMGWAVDAQHALSVSTLSHHGLYSMTFRHLWPAAYTYGLTVRKLDGVRRVERLPMPPYVYVYRCELGDGKEVLVAFCDDHVGQNHDEPTAEIQARIPLRAERALLTHVITDIGATEPRTERVDVRGGFLHLRLTEYPVFIEPLRGKSSERPKGSG